MVKTQFGTNKRGNKYYTGAMAYFLAICVIRIADGIYSVSLTIRTPYCEDTLMKHDYIRVTGCVG